MPEVERQMHQARRLHFQGRFEEELELLHTLRVHTPQDALLWALMTVDAQTRGGATLPAPGTAAYAELRAGLVQVFQAYEAAEEVTRAAIDFTWPLGRYRWWMAQMQERRPLDSPIGYVADAAADEPLACDEGDDTLHVTMSELREAPSRRVWQRRLGTALAAGAASVAMAWWMV